MPKYNTLWAVVEEIDAPDEETALSTLRGRLTKAGFIEYEGTYDLVPDGYELAYLSENQDDEDEGDPAAGYWVEHTPGGYVSVGLIEDGPHPRNPEGPPRP